MISSVRMDVTAATPASCVLNPCACPSQRGCSQGTLWRLAAEAVLEVVEGKGAMGAREVRFHMLEGDFEVRKQRCPLDSTLYPINLALHP